MLNPRVGVQQRRDNEAARRPGGWSNCLGARSPAFDGQGAGVSAVTAAVETDVLGAFWEAPGRIASHSAAVPGRTVLSVPLIATG